MDEWVSVKEAAARLGVSTKTVRRRVERGQLQTRADTSGRGTPRKLVLLPPTPAPVLMPSVPFRRKRLRWVATGGVLLLVLSIVADVSGAWQGVGGVLEWATGQHGAQLAIADLEFIDREHDFPRLDVTVRNLGESTIVLKRAEFHVQQVWWFKPSAVPYPIAPSGTYDVVIPLQAPAVQQLRMAQAVPSHGVDKFTFLLGHRGSDLGEEYVIALRVELIFNESNRRVTTDQLLYMTRYAPMTSSMQSDGYYDSLLVFNAYLVPVISSIQAVRNKRLDNFLAYANNKQQ